MELKGKAALITGGGTGLGRAITLALARAGVAVAVNYARSAEDAHATVSEVQGLGGRALPIQADVSDPAAVQAMVREVATRLGGLDILVNNAGITRYVPLSDLDQVRAEDFDQILRVNVTGAFLCAQAASPYLRAHGCGKIINVASNSAFGAEGSSIPYIVSKAGLVALTRCLARALAPSVQVNAVAPGWLATRWLSLYFPPEKQQQILAEAGPGAVDLEEVAQTVVLFARSESTTGQTLVIDRGELLA
jgi:3-oxoacyl-[acyl-carrier protein] reductase